MRKENLPKAKMKKGKMMLMVGILMIVLILSSFIVPVAAQITAGIASSSTPGAPGATSTASSPTAPAPTESIPEYSKNSIMIGAFPDNTKVKSEGKFYKRNGNFIQESTSKDSPEWTEAKFTYTATATIGGKLVTTPITANNFKAAEESAKKQLGSSVQVITSASTSVPSSTTSSGFESKPVGNQYIVYKDGVPQKVFDNSQDAKNYITAQTAQSFTLVSSTKISDNQVLINEGGKTITLTRRADDATLWDNEDKLKTYKATDAIVPSTSISGGASSLTAGKELLVFKSASSTGASATGITGGSGGSTSTTTYTNLKPYLKTNGLGQIVLEERSPDEIQAKGLSAGYTQITDQQKKLIMDNPKGTLEYTSTSVTVTTSSKVGDQELIKKISLDNSVNGDSKGNKREEQYFKNNENAKLITEGPINDKGEITSPKVTAQGLKCSDGQSITGELPWTSNQWKINKDGYLLYGTQKGKFVDNNFVKDDGGYVRGLKEPGKETIILEKTADGKYLFTQGKTIKDVPIAENLVKDSHGNEMITDDYLRNIADVQQAAKNLRLDVKSLSRDGTQVKAGNELLADFSKSNTITDPSTKIQMSFSRDKAGKIYVSKVVDPSTGKSLVFGTDSEGKDYMQIGDDGTKYYAKTIEKRVYYCKEGGGSCFDFSSGTVFNQDGSPASDPELQAIWSKVGETVRKAAGGQTNAEIMATRVFTILESAQSGFGKLFSLFMDDEDLIEWRNDIDEWFCDTIIGGGKDCWVSEVCGDYIDKEEAGTLTIDVPGTMAETIAHVEGERMDLFTISSKNQSSREYLYKLSYAVKNPKPYERKYFNVVLYGDTTKWLYNQSIKIKENHIFSKTGSRMLVKYSNTKYDKICIIFADDIQTGIGEAKDRVCNDIVPVVTSTLPAEYSEDESDI